MSESDIWLDGSDGACVSAFGSPGPASRPHRRRDQPKTTSLSPQGRSAAAITSLMTPPGRSAPTGCLAALGRGASSKRGQLRGARADCVAVIVRHRFSRRYDPRPPVAVAACERDEHAHGCRSVPGAFSRQRGASMSRTSDAALSARVHREALLTYRDAVNQQSGNSRLFGREQRLHKASNLVSPARTSFPPTFASPCRATIAQLESWACATASRSPAEPHLQPCRH
jgi:hypothetical protein